MNIQEEGFTAPPFDCPDHHLTWSWYQCTQCMAHVLKLECCCSDVRCFHPPEGCWED